MLERNTFPPNINLTEGGVYTHAHIHTHARTHTHDRTHAHTCTPARTHTDRQTDTDTHTHTHTHTTHTHTRTQARTHTHTHTRNLYFVLNKLFFLNQIQPPHHVTPSQTTPYLILPGARAAGLDVRRRPPVGDLQHVQIVEREAEESVLASYQHLVPGLVQHQLCVAHEILVFEPAALHQHS